MRLPFKLVSGAAVVVLIVFTCLWLYPSSAEARTNRSDILDGNWSGIWVSLDSTSTGYFYEADMTLRRETGNQISGRIKWTLRQSPRSYEQRKLGLTAIEHVRGTFDPATRIIRINGYDKTDPDTVIGLDTYQLFLADNNNVIGGITSSGGTWQGLFSVARDGYRGK